MNGVQLALLSLIELMPVLGIEVVGEFKKKVPNRRPDHYVVVEVNNKRVLKSEKRCSDPAPQWKADEEM